MKKLLLSLFLFTTFLLFSEGFAPETLIKTPNGYTPIEHIDIGQSIQSYDHKNNAITSHPVIAKHNYTAKNYLVIKLENEDITCSLNQKFYLHALNKWIKAKELINNETIRKIFCDEFSILDITKIDEPKELHTLTINPHHNFFVTESDILGHNFAPAVIPIITYSVGEGVILFGGLGIAGVTGIAYRRAIQRTLKGIVRNLNGETKEQIITNYNYPSFNQPNSSENPDDENDNDKVNYSKKEIQKIAEKLGFKKTNFYSHGQNVFQKGKKFITKDIDSHNGGFWKMADSVKNLSRKQTRLGTFDELLNRIGD